MEQVPAEEQKSLIDLAMASGMTDEQLEDQLITCVAGLGTAILEEIADGSDEITFELSDDVGEIEVIVRRVPSSQVAVTPDKRYLH